MTHSLLHLFTPLGSPTLTSFYPLWTIYPLTLTSFYPPPSLAAQLLHHFTTSEQFTPSLLLHFTPLGSWILSSFYAPLDNLPPQSYTFLPPLAAQLLHHFNYSEQITPSLLHHFTPLGSPTLISFYPLWTNFPLNPITFYHHW